MTWRDCDKTKEISLPDVSEFINEHTMIVPHWGIAQNGLATFVVNGLCADGETRDVWLFSIDDPEKVAIVITAFQKARPV